MLDLVGSLIGLLVDEVGGVGCLFWLQSEIDACDTYEIEQILQFVCSRFTTRSQIPVYLLISKYKSESILLCLPKISFF